MCIGLCVCVHVIEDPENFTRIWPIFKHPVKEANLYFKTRADNFD